MSRFRKGTMDHDGDGRIGGSMKENDMTKEKNEAKAAADAIEKLKEKDGEANNESARTNEILAARDGGEDYDPVKASIEANDPSMSRAAYTSEKSGFNEDAQRKAQEDADKKAHHQAGEQERRR